MTSIEFAKAIAEAYGVNPVSAHYSIVEVCKSKKINPFTAKSEERWIEIYS